MTSKTKKSLDSSFSKVLGMLCILAVFILPALTFSVYAKTSTQRHSNEPTPQNYSFETDQRFKTLEAELLDTKAQLVKLDAETRLTRLESALDTIKNLLIALVAGIGLMLLEAGHRLLIQKTGLGEKS